MVIDLALTSIFSNGLFMIMVDLYSPEEQFPIAGTHTPWSLHLVTCQVSREPANIPDRHVTLAEVPGMTSVVLGSKSSHRPRVGQRISVRYGTSP